MAEDPPVQSLNLSMPGTPTSTMDADSKASQSRAPEVAVGSSALPRGFKTLRRKDGLLSTRTLFPHLSTVDVDAIDGDKPSEAFRSSGALTPRTSDSKRLNLFDLHQCSKPDTQRSGGNTNEVVDKRGSLGRLTPDDHSDRQGASEEQMVDRGSLVSLFTAPNSCFAISSPGLNTLRRTGAKISAEMGYSSQNMWDVDTDESGSPLEGSTFTRARNGEQSASIDLPINRTKVRGLPVTKTTLENMALRFEDIEVSPRVTIRRSPTRSKRNMSTHSTRSALRRSIACSNRPSSIWDPEDDEFERWPGKETLDRIGNNFTLHRGTSRHSVKSGLDAARGSTYRAEDDDSLLTEKETNLTPNTDYTNLSAQQHEDLIHELLDKESGNPYGSDANDELVRQFCSSSVLGLPALSPACHMHVLNWEAYMDSEDDLVRNALPRLCDAVATVLYFTNPQCLEDFLNPDIETFEWRRDGHCLMIRREGNEVIVGTFHNFATNYVWTYFVRSSISSTGAWKETFAAVASGVTFVSAKGVEFDKFESEPSAHGISPTNEKYALYMGRELAFFLLQKEVWNYRKHNVWTIQWEADGVVTIPKDHDRYQMWSIKEMDE